MKTIKVSIIITIICAGALNSFAQLTVNAGNDVVCCVGVDTIQLGNTPTALGGFPPYTYVWETSYTIGSNTFYASTFLDDITSSNPLLISTASNLESLTFKLTVTDSISNTKTDSVIILFSQFASLLPDNFATINQGDSVQLLHTIGGGIPPLTYLWSPNYYLSDFTTENPWAKPDTTTYYACTVTDYVGCQTSNGDIFEVYVNASSIIERDINNSFKIHPNPSKNNLIIEHTNNDYNELTVEIYSSLGKLELVNKVNSFEKTIINTDDIPQGIYFISIKNKQEIIASKKWIKI